MDTESYTTLLPVVFGVHPEVASSDPLVDASQTLVITNDLRDSCTEQPQQQQQLHHQHHHHHIAGAKKDIMSIGKKRDSRQYIVINEERLISEVQRRPILYDKALKGYRKPTIREHAWQEVATILDSTGTLRGECWRWCDDGSGSVPVAGVVRCYGRFLRGAPPCCCVRVRLAAVDTVAVGGGGGSAGKGDSGHYRTGALRVVARCARALACVCLFDSFLLLLWLSHRGERALRARVWPASRHAC